MRPNTGKNIAEAIRRVEMSCTPHIITIISITTIAIVAIIITTLIKLKCSHRKQSRMKV